MKNIYVFILETCGKLTLALLLVLFAVSIYLIRAAQLTKIAISPTAIFKSQGGAIFVMGEKCLKIPFNSNIAGLQSRPGLHIIFYRLKEASLFGTHPCKNQTILILIGLSMNKRKMMLR